MRNEIQFRGENQNTVISTENSLNFYVLKYF